MKPAFALNFTPEGLALLHRAATGWMVLGETPFDAEDLGPRLARLRDAARGLAPEAGLTTKLVLPASQILYLELEAPGPDAASRRRQVLRALEGRTPYDVEDLAFDWSGEGERVQVAVVARETLDEAEAFAELHGLNPVSFVAAPEEAQFDGEPFFGQAGNAREHLPAGARLTRDNEPVRVTGMFPSCRVDALAEAGALAGMTIAAAAPVAEAAEAPQDEAAPAPEELAEEELAEPVFEPAPVLAAEPDVEPAPAFEPEPEIAPAPEPEQAFAAEAAPAVIDDSQPEDAPRPDEPRAAEPAWAPHPRPVEEDLSDDLAAAFLSDSARSLEPGAPDDSLPAAGMAEAEPLPLALDSLPEEHLAEDDLQDNLAAPDQPAPDLSQDSLPHEAAELEAPAPLAASRLAAEPAPGFAAPPRAPLTAARVAPQSRAEARAGLFAHLAANPNALNDTSEVEEAPFVDLSEIEEDDWEHRTARRPSITAEPPVAAPAAPSGLSTLATAMRNATASVRNAPRFEPDPDLPQLPPVEPRPEIRAETRPELRAEPRPDARPEPVAERPQSVPATPSLRREPTLAAPRPAADTDAPARTAPEAAPQVPADVPVSGLTGVTAEDAAWQAPAYQQGFEEDDLDNRAFDSLPFDAEHLVDLPPEPPPGPMPWELSAEEAAEDAAEDAAEPGLPAARHLDEAPAAAAPVDTPDTAPDTEAEDAVFASGNWAGRWSEVEVAAPTEKPLRAVPPPPAPAAPVLSAPLAASRPAGRADQVRADQVRAEPMRAEPARGEPMRAEPRPEPAARRAPSVAAPAAPRTPPPLKAPTPGSVTAPMIGIAADPPPEAPVAPPAPVAEPAPSNGRLLAKATPRGAAAAAAAATGPVLSAPVAAPAGKSGYRAPVTPKFRPESDRAPDRLAAREMSTADRLRAPLAGAVPARGFDEAEDGYRAARATGSVFGAEYAEPPKRRKLGLTLVLMLVLFLGAVAIWAGYLQPQGDGQAQLIGSEPATEVAAVSAPTLAGTATPEALAEAGATDHDSLLSDAALDALAGDRMQTAAPGAAEGAAPAALPQVASTTPGPLADTGAPADTETTAAGLAAAGPAAQPTQVPAADALAALLPIEEPATTPAATPAAAPAASGPTPDASEGLPPRPADPAVADRDSDRLVHAQAAADPPPLAQQTSLPFGTTFDFGPDGLVKATRDGALTPDGTMVYARRPDAVPPSRPEAVLQAAAGTTAPIETSPAPATPAAILAEAATPTMLPRARPADLKVALAAPEEKPGAGEAALPPADPALAGMRPKAMTFNAVSAAEAARSAEAARTAAAAAEAEASGNVAVASSRKPLSRPQDFSAGINEALAAAVAMPEPALPAANLAPMVVAAAPVQKPRVVAPTPAPAPVAAPAPMALAPVAPKQELHADEIDEPEPVDVAPDIPTSASVAKQATIANAMPLRQLNLIGVYGASSNRRALVRLGNGKYQRVQIGDRLDGGKVAAISQNQLTYVKGGRSVVLRMIDEG